METAQGIKHTLKHPRPERDVHKFPQMQPATSSAHTTTTQNAPVRTLKRSRVELEIETLVREPPAKRQARATSSIPTKNMGNVARSSQRNLRTASATVPQQAEEAGTRRSKRLKNKAPTTYH